MLLDEAQELDNKENTLSAIKRVLGHQTRSPGSPRQATLSNLPGCAMANQLLKRQ